MNSAFLNAIISLRSGFAKPFLKIETPEIRQSMDY